MQQCVVGAKAAASADTPTRRLRVEPLGRMRYRDALRVQALRHQAVADGLLEDTLLLVEHEPVITLGRSGNGANVLADAASLAARGIEVVQTGRGGDVTYHGPGQLVAYPIVALQEDERDVRRWVWKLEELILRTVAAFGVTAVRVDGLRGMWVGNDKLAAIGIRLMRWVSCHGLALNVCCALEDFAGIVPCGLHGRGVTSLAALAPPGPSLSQVQRQLVRHAGEVFGRRLCAADEAPPPHLSAEARHAAGALLV